MGSPAGVTSASSGRNVPESGGGGSDAGSSSAEGSGSSSGVASAGASSVASVSAWLSAAACSAGACSADACAAGISSAAACSAGRLLDGGLRDGLRLGGLLRSGRLLGGCLCGGHLLGDGLRRLAPARRMPVRLASSRRPPPRRLRPPPGLGLALGGGLRGGDLADGLRARVGAVGAAGERQQRDGRHRRHPDGRGVPSSPRDSPCSTAPCSTASGYCRTAAASRSPPVIARLVNAATPRAAHGVGGGACRCWSTSRSVCRWSSSWCCGRSWAHYRAHPIAGLSLNPADGPGDPALRRGHGRDRPVQDVPG